MSDKELLELAAKAADYKYLEYTSSSYPNKSGLLYGNPNGRLFIWNALTDDGDAFRLAVKLNIAISFPMGNGKFSSVTAGQVGSSNVGCHELFNPDPCAATRRAIVRAAAEIGRTK